MQVDNLWLEKLIGKGSFGEVHLTKIKGDNKLYATKIYNREKFDNSIELKKYLKSEVTILKKLNHPNIVKLIEAKKTKKHFYLVMEYCNGGDLLSTLEKYKKKYQRPFSEEIVQYLMRKLIPAFNYIHSLDIMHRDIKLENILLNYNTEEDRLNLNIMKSTPKIIDFGLAIHLKNSLAESIIGNPINMSPLLLKKITSNGKIRKLGYDKKEDIWSIGSICYEMLIGHPAFDAEDLDELVDKVEKGNYNIPISLSKEVVSFLNGMLQYEPKERLTCEQLINHVFLIDNIRNFHRIDLNKVRNNITKNNKLEINIKKNKSIWAIFNQEDENKLININSDQFSFFSDGKENSNNIQQNIMIPSTITNNISTQKYYQNNKMVNIYQAPNCSNLNNIYYSNGNNNIFIESNLKPNNIEKNHINDNNFQEKNFEYEYDIFG